MPAWKSNEGMGVWTWEDRDRNHKSYADASICCRCGRGIAPGAAVWMLRCRLIWPLTIVNIVDDRLGAGCTGCAGARKIACTGCCPGCKRAVYLIADELSENRNCRPPAFFCSNRCRNRVYGARFRRRHSRPKTVHALAACRVCGCNFEPKRSDAKTCSPACRQKAYRERGRYR